MQTSSRWVSASILITIFVLLLFGIVFVYQDQEIRDLRDQLSVSQINVQQAENLINELNGKLEEALKEPEPVPVFQRVQIPDAGVTFLLPDTWSQPVFSRNNDFRQFGDGIESSLTVNVGLETEGIITYKSNDYVIGRESPTPEIFGEQLTSGIDAFCNNGLFGAEPVGTCEVISQGGQRFATYTIGSFVNLGSHNRRVYFGVIGTLPGAPYSLLNFWVPLSDREFTPEEMNEVLEGLRNNEVNDLVTQAMLDRVEEGNNIVRSLEFSTPVSLQDYQLLEHGEHGYAFYAPNEWQFEINPSQTAFTVETSDFDVEKGTGIYVTLGRYEQLGRDAAGPIIEEGTVLVNGVLANYLIAEGRGLDDSGATLTDRIVSLEHKGEAYTFEMITGSDNSNLIDSFDMMVQSFHFTQ